MNKDYKLRSPERDPFELMKIADHHNLSGLKLHIYHRGAIPDIYEVAEIEHRKWSALRDKLEEEYECEPDNRIEWTEYDLHNKMVITYGIHLKEGVTLYSNGAENSVKLYFDSNTDDQLVHRIREQLENIKSEQSDFQIGFLQADMGMLGVKFRHFKPYEKDLTGFLGTDIEKLRDRMIREINRRNQSGLYLLHGKPGTGKTSFIKSILGAIEKKAIFITPAYTDKLASPELIGLLMDYPESVIIIEDAETVLMERQADNSNAVSNLLNLTDGFPADFLNLNLICTFNTDIDNIDPALLREGRLNGIQEFKKLLPQQANELAGHMGKQFETDEPMTLAEVCNAGNERRKLAVNGIGF